GGGIAGKVASTIPSESSTATLTTGGNNTDTTYAGVIRDGVTSMPTRQPAGEKAVQFFSGPLAIFKTGTGTQTLTGNNTYTGGTTVAQGTLAAGSAKAFGSGDLTMTGGTLRTTGPLAVDIGAGNILFTGGTYQANVGGLLPAVQHDQLLTTGMANISGGTLALVQLNNYHLMAGDKVVLLSAAGGVSGGSANGTAVPASHVTGLSAFSNTPLLVPAVNLYTTSVILEAMQGSFTGFSGLTPNQFAVAQALDSLIGQTGGKTGVFKELDFLDNQSQANVLKSLDMISPEELTSIFQLAKSLANVQTANIQRRLDEIRALLDQIVQVNSVNVSIGGSRSVSRSKEIAPDERWGMWFTGSGEFTHVGSTTNAAGFNLDSGGVTAGVDYRFTDKFAAGISLGYMNTTASLANNGKVDVDGGRVGAYATYFDRGFHVDASVSGGPNSYSTRRTTPNNTVATASPGGTEVNLLLATGYDWKVGSLTIGPTASFQYSNVQLDGFTETGTFAPLSVIRKNADSMRTALGMKATYDLKVGRAILRPEVRASWQHEFGDTSYSLTSTFATLGGSAFTVAGPETGRDSLLVGAGFSILLNDRLSIYAYYDGELLRTNYSSNNVSAGFRWKF
ncbi:MAG: autotransporter domain-containing protein, partial [Chthoniobacteraceae bacterium]